MSTVLRASQEALDHLLHTIQMERDPIRRFQIINILEGEARKRIREDKREAAYAAACTVTVKDLTVVTGLSHPHITQMVNGYADDHRLTSPARRVRPSDLSDYMDLRRA
jgi:hypothetical protein